MNRTADFTDESPANLRRRQPPKEDCRMGALSDLARSINSLSRNPTEYGNFVCLLVLFIFIYGFAFFAAAIPAASVALVNISAKHLPVQRDVWISPLVFRQMLSTMYVLMLVPAAVVATEGMLAGHVVTVCIMALDYAAGLYHGAFIGQTI